ncbi:4-fold beta flower protein [Mesorhizobium sp. P15089B]
MVVSDGIYLYSGLPVAWIDEEHLWSYSARWLGWVQDGVIYNRRGHVAFFTEGAQGGPAN